MKSNLNKIHKHTLKEYPARNAVYCENCKKQWVTTGTAATTNEGTIVSALN